MQPWAGHFNSVSGEEKREEKTDDGIDGEEMEEIPSCPLEALT